VPRRGVHVFQRRRAVSCLYVRNMREKGGGWFGSEVGKWVDEALGHARVYWERVGRRLCPTDTRELGSTFLDVDREKRYRLVIACLRAVF